MTDPKQQIAEVKMLLQRITTTDVCLPDIFDEVMNHLYGLAETVQRLEAALELIRSFRGYDEDALASWQIRAKQQEERIAELTRERDECRDELQRGKMEAAQ